MLASSRACRAAERENSLKLVIKVDTYPVDSASLDFREACKRNRTVGTLLRSVASFYLRKLRTENVPETDQSAFQLGEECLLTRNRPTLFTAFRHTAEGLSHFRRRSWRISMLWSQRSHKGATTANIVRTSLQFPKTLYPAPALCGSKAVASSQGSRAFPIKGARNLLSRTNFRSREATGRETHRYTL